LENIIDIAKIDRQLSTLGMFHKMDPDMPMGQIYFFLKAASSEGLCIADIARATGVTRSTSTRYLKNLSGTKDAPDTGLGLLRSFRNPKRPSEKLVVLTEKGESVLDQLVLQS
jgi:DNA-binding MarR family transcriptional regulator